MQIGYFTSKTGNTQRFAETLELPAFHIAKKVFTEPFILFAPTYADAAGNHSVPTPIIKFLNNESNRSNMIGVVGFGNRNFGKMFAIAADVISYKCNVPILYKVEMFGTNDDIHIVKEKINELRKRLYCS